MPGYLQGFTTLIVHQDGNVRELVRLISEAGGEALTAQLTPSRALSDDSAQHEDPLTSEAAPDLQHAQPAARDALAAWLDGDVDAVVLLSPQAVREFARQFNPLETIPAMDPYFPALICADEATTRAAHANGLSVDLVANPASSSGLFNSICRAAELTEELDQHL